MKALPENDFVSTLDLLPDAVIVVNTKGIIVAHNKQTFSLLGYHEGELIDRPLSSIIPARFRNSHDEHFNTFLHEYSTHRLGIGKKLWALHKDGHEIDVDIALSTYTKHDDLLTIAVMRDITDKLMLEHDIGNLKRIKEELERFGYTVSHDLKGPLQRIKMLTALITQELSDEKKDDIKVMSKFLNDSVDSMEKLIHGILDSARLGYNEKNDLIDLNAILEEVQHTIHIPDRFNIRVKKKLPSIVGNYTKMIQVFQNLITNAIKYNRTNAGLLEINWLENKKEYEISFADNGVIIPENKRHRMFRLFERATDEDAGPSHGIGLFIVKNIIQTAGGQINYRESSLGGSEFYFNWPK